MKRTEKRWGWVSVYGDTEGQFFTLAPVGYTEGEAAKYMGEHEPHEKLISVTLTYEVPDEGQ